MNRHLSELLMNVVTAVGEQEPGGGPSLLGLGRLRPGVLGSGGQAQRPWAVLGQTAWRVIEATSGF